MLIRRHHIKIEFEQKTLRIEQTSGPDSAAVAEPSDVRPSPDTTQPMEIGGGPDLTSPSPRAERAPASQRPLPAKAGADGEEQASDDTASRDSNRS